MSKSLRLAVIQPRVVRPDEQANVARAVEYARDAADQGAELVVFPECYPGPYSGPADFSAREVLAAAAQANGIYLGYGFMESAGDNSEAFFNSYEILDPDGNSALKYHKLVPSPVDPELSNKKSIAGDTLELVNTPWGKIGVLICWEAWFPELCRTLAMRGADLVLFPTGGMLYHLAPVWSQVIQARSTENLIYTASCVNLFGVEDGFAHICAPEGELASSTDEGCLLADLDLERLNFLREADETLSMPKYYKTIPGLWRYNRPELYGQGKE
ncbi:MAG: carbon-nitrogen hydrolase family protein [Anaerolineales bacterium]|nr:carbon-nitrogen hydrolase family protein [Anaerolineales bacterium]